MRISAVPLHIASEECTPLVRQIWHRLKGTLTFAIVPLALFGCADSPQVRDVAGNVAVETTIDTYSLRIGDCTAEVSNGQAENFTVIPCPEPHYWEVFAGMTLSGEKFPGNEKVTQKAGEYCEQAFAEFIGKSRSKSAYDLTFLQPVSATWKFGDREILCLAGSNVQLTTDSLENIKK